MNEQEKKEMVDRVVKAARHDPFLRRYLLNNDDFNADLCGAWEAEGLKRYVAFRMDDPDLVRLQTYLWDRQMLEEIANMPLSGDRQPQVHVDVGVGLHFFKDSRIAMDSYFEGSGTEDLMAKLYGHGVRMVALRIDPDGNHYPLLFVGDFADHMMPARFQPRAGFVYIDPTQDEGGAPVAYGWNDLAPKMTALLNQRVVVAEEERAPRGMRRQERHPLTDETRMITVTWRRLRQAGTAESGEPVERDKHWWVSGHFRNQFYRSDGRHRLIFIEPHVKGNPSAPLYQPARVNVVRR